VYACHSRRYPDKERRAALGQTLIALVATKNARRKYQITIKRKAPAQPEEAFVRVLLQKIT
jgi:hypothetical protein